jgi:dipeptidyl-peptidase-4
MLRPHRSFGLIVAATFLLTSAPRPSAEHVPAIAQYLKPGMPTELVSAKKADRIAWIAYEEGKRNVYVAAAPLFHPRRVTAFLKDDGTDMTSVRIADDGSVVVFVRGSAPNGEGWVANPSSDPNGAERAIWAVRTAGGGPAWRLAEGSGPEVSPDGRFVLYVKDGQIYRARVTEAPATTPIDKGERPFIDAWGRNSGPKWSPDGTKVAFWSNRVDHSFIGLYDVKTRALHYLAPSVDRDTSPTWSADGTHLAFLRRPGLPFGQQSTPGSGSGAFATGVGGRQGGGAAGRLGGGGRQAGPAPAATSGTAPGAAAPGAAAASAAAGRQSGGGRGGRGGEAPIPAGAPLGQEPGLYRSSFPGGYTLSLMVTDVATGEAREVWHNAPGDQMFTGINAIQWAGDSVIFPLTVQGDEWDRYYAINLSGAAPAPVRLTTTDGIIEDATAITLSKDGRTLYYCTNAGDIDRRHIWAVPTAGGTPTQVTTGAGIENVPVALASGKHIAVLSSDAKRPFSVGVWPLGGGAQKVIYPVLGADFPMAAEVVPTNVTLKAEDGVEFHNQLFLPNDIKPGEKRPALIFVHGGPARQMLLGWHYLSFYHVFYGVNQWLTSQGYIVLSVNYRLGVGYGRSFRQAAESGARGNAEYRDVLAAGKWLAARADVDPNRVGIWGLSYGGLLTSEALARNSDIFKAGVDLAGVHLEGNSLDPADVSYTSSAISAIDTWKSPVLLIQGDDDRNVNFAQTVGLVQLLRARGIYHELIVYPDDVHETLLHQRWLYTFSRMEAFLTKFLGENAAGRSGK